MKQEAESQGPHGVQYCLDDIFTHVELIDDESRLAHERKGSEVQAEESHVVRVLPSRLTEEGESVPDDGYWEHSCCHRLPKLVVGGGCGYT